MAELTPAQRAAADAMISQTFANPAMQTQGWGTPQPQVMRAQASRPPAWTNNGPATFQMAQELARAPATRYAVDANGQRIDPIKLGYGSQPARNPAVEAATQVGQTVAPPFPASVDQRLKARSDAANRAWLEAQAVPPGGIQPGWTLRGANPGMGGAMIGNGVMAPGIPPQGPPPPGVAPTVWAGGGQGGAPIMRPAGGTVQRATSPNGYIYGRAEGGPWNQQARAPWTQGMSPADQYAVANAGGQIAALGRQAQATGQTGVYNYNQGVRGTTVTGQSPAAAYEAAAARSRDPGTSGEGGNPSWW